MGAYGLSPEGDICVVASAKSLSGNDFATNHAPDILEKIVYPF